jgi:hypothetical protein
MDFITALLMLALMFCAYFLPALISQKKQNASGILILNLFLGWTFIGWVVALVWAVSDKDKVNV